MILNNDKPTNINQLSKIIKQASFVVANDTGPAHICSHLNKNGLALFGSHTTAKKVNIGICDKLFCRVGSGDELAKGNSTFS